MCVTTLDFGLRRVARLTRKKAMKNQPREKSKDASEVLVCASSGPLRGSFAVSLLLTVFGMAFCLQQDSRSQVESDEEDHAADKQMLALYDADPVKTEEQFGVDADFIQELREHVAEVESAVR